MDPLSVTASIAGLLMAAGKICSLLVVVSSVRNAPSAIRDARLEVKHAEIALRSLQQYLECLDLINQERKALIQIDELRVTLTDAMLAFSDFEALLQTLSNLAKGRAAISWPRYSKQIDDHVARIQRYKASLTLMLNVFQWYADTWLLFDSSG
jgi:hypothetical protein